MKLLQLFKNNADAPRVSRIEQREREATVYIYDIIGEDWLGGISAREFVPQLQALDVDVIHLRINSPGGDVFDGRTMATAIKQHPAKVIAHIDGHAASAATYVALAADEVEISAGGFFMIHNAWTLALGNAADFEQTAEVLRKVDGSIVDDYERKTGASREQLEAWMAATTWFTAEEALDNKFVDRIADAPAAKNQWNLAAYDNAPAALLNNPEPEPSINRAQLERRLMLLEKIAP